MGLPDDIRKLLRRKDINVSQLSRDTGIHRVHLERMAAGERGISALNAEKIAVALKAKLVLRLPKRLRQIDSD